MATVPHAEAINKLVKPANMHYDTWRHMRRLLRMLSGYGDHIYPSQRTLAQRLGLSLATVQRLVVRAEVEGWIIRAERPTPGRGRSVTDYEILLLPNMSRNGTDKKDIPPTGVYQKFSPSSRGRRGLVGAAPRPRVNRFPGVCYLCQQPIRAQEGRLHGPLPVHRYCEAKMNKDWYRQQAEDLNGPSTFGEDPQAPLPTHNPKVIHPAARLAHRFEDRWFDRVLHVHPEWKWHRSIQLGPAIGYIKSQFLDKDYSPDYVEAYFDAFFDELLYEAGSLKIRDGQTVWQLFCGWWGRSLVPDPAIEKAKQAMADAVSAELREETARRKAAEARILAADEPDPEDWKIVRGQA